MPRALPRLTPRQAEVLTCLAEGMANKGIGGRLGVEVTTVALHIREACRRLGAETREQAIAIAMAEGLIKPRLRPASDVEHRCT